MAIPTNFIICTPSAGTTKVCPLVGHDNSANGVFLMDIGGTKTPRMIPIADNMSILLTGTYTDAQIIAAVQAYLRERGKQTDGSAGGAPLADQRLITPTHSTCT